MICCCCCVDFSVRWLDRSEQCVGSCSGGGRQCRDVEPHRRRRDERARRGGRDAGPGPGDDEQPHARQPRRRLHLLRDPRRGPGGLPRRRRPLGRARRDEQHAQHAGRGARAGVPAARARAIAAPRLRRGRCATAAATGSCARSRRACRWSTRCCPSAGRSRRAAPPEAGPGAPGPEPPPAWRGARPRSCPRRLRGGSKRAMRYGSRRPAEGATGPRPRPPGIDATSICCAGRATAID